jgi:hypothetical protein
MRPPVQFFTLNTIKVAKKMKSFTFPWSESLVSITDPFTRRSTDPKLLSLGVLVSGVLLIGSPNMFTSGGAYNKQG